MPHIDKYIEAMNSYLSGVFTLNELSTNFERIYRDDDEENIRLLFSIVDKIYADIDVTTQDSELISSNTGMYISENELISNLKQAISDLKVLEGSELQ